MYISKITKEDLSTLYLIVDKLENNFNEYGISFFNYSISKKLPSSIYDECYGDIDLFPDYIDVSDSHFVDRVTMYFNSKADFDRNFINEDDSIMVSDNRSASTLAIEWDYLTNVFNIRIGLNQYTEDNRNPNKMRKSAIEGLSFYLDFKFENRRDIILIKTRLGKLYKKIKRDKAIEKDVSTRIQISNLVEKAFPDLFDSLILGVSDDGT